MSSGEAGPDTFGTTCAVCGAALTDAEQLAVRETGAPALCTIHALEVLPADPEEEAAGSDAV
jgi:hypothetical protein